jgi:divinyl protochlorophyllide a 8-vinyl-reductase
MTAPAGAAGGRIGPNAIIQLAQALPALVGGAETRRLFERAGLADHLRTPPQGMVAEDDVRRLHGALRSQFGARLAAQAARDAGRRTGDYLLEHRIPRPVQALLKRLPAAWAARVLLAAISRHAWTFAGNGRFDARAGRPVVLRLRGNPLCAGLHADAPACDFYAATFERLFVVLVHPGSRVREVACEACGDVACEFEICWSG